jgi:glucose/arabinose dehydrogenase
MSDRSRPVACVCAAAAIAALALAGCDDGQDARAQPGPGKGSGAAGVQTRAPPPQARSTYKVAVVANGLEHPWAIAFLPDGRMLATERPGRMRIVEPGGRLSTPVAGVPKVRVADQGGLFDVALDPDFARSRILYFSYFEPRAGGDGLTVARAKLTLQGDGGALSDLKVLFRAEPTFTGNANIGGRIVVDHGDLYVTVGDRFVRRDEAQALSSDLGKVVRIGADGAIPKDNPFVGRAGARPEIWTLGHRNGEGLAINPSTGQLWEIEHGARGGDEVDVISKGRNYGWPVITYGVDYSGAKIGVGMHKAGMEQPLYYWDPSIAPSGMAFYTAGLFPGWKGDLFVGALKGTHVSRLVLGAHGVVAEEPLVGELHKRIRDVRQGPDGALYLATDEGSGQILKLVPTR